MAQFSWARPHQLVKEPRLFVDGTSRRDVIQVRSEESLHLKTGHLLVCKIITDRVLLVLEDLERNFVYTFSRIILIH